MTTTDQSPVLQLAQAGVSVWLDDLSRELLQSGDLQRLIDERHVLGVTTNPTIFASALAKGERYDEQVARLAAAGTSVDDTVFALTTDDVREACDAFTAVYERTDHVDGRVSIEVDPRLARDGAGTLAAAKTLWATVGRPNALIKIPATLESLPAITGALAAGISVNVTLIFSLERYRAVMEAYLSGLEQARAAGHDLAQIASVASFFVSRVDTDIDPQLTALGTDEALALRGRAAVANARLAYQAYAEVFSGPRWEALAAAGARAQRPLWASTGVKNPAYPDTLYVTELVAPGTVNTMPAGTLSAVEDHGAVTGDTITGGYQEAAAVLAALEALGISFDEVTTRLEVEAVDKFTASWSDLLGTVSDALARAASTDR